jgi:hypothetical protein
MLKWMMVLLSSGCVVWGAAMLVWSREMSERYNAWTTGLRTRHSNVLSPPPTAQQRETNTRIMTWIIRVFGVEVSLAAIWALIKFWNIP